MAKRLFDLLGATLALLLLSPLLLAAALVVRLDTPGPVFFRQERVGRHGVPFRIHKFRTMHHGAGGPLLTAADDPRITRAGAWLRRTRIDELPQFIDVLLGHMSLVGPRPEVPRYVAQYPAGCAQRVLAVRPGITDPASLAFIDEAALLARGRRPRARVHRGHPAGQAAAPPKYAEQATLGSDLCVLLATLWRLRAAVGGR